MPYDSKLVEAVARAICVGDPDEILLEQGGTTRPRWTSFATDARLALRAIDASGTYWVAPWDDPHSMPGSPVARDYAETRDVCLSERREEGR